MSDYENEFFDEIIGVEEPVIREGTERDYNDIALNIYMELQDRCEEFSLPLLDRCYFYNFIELLEDNNVNNYVFDQ
jgi:hypothetical protein